MSKQTKLIVLAFCLVKLTLHLLADMHSGFHGDELLHIETGHHLAFGFMEFPPVIAVLAFFQNLFQSESVFVHHLFAHVAAILILVIVSKITVELGGKSVAVFLVLMCIVIAPGFGRSQQLFQPVVFSQLFWVLNFYWLLKYVRTPDKRFLWFLTFTCALAFLTKYDAVFFIFGLFALLLFKNTRQALIQHKFWWNVLVFLLVISPNIVWQFINDFPVLKMFNRLYETQLDRLSPTEVIGGLIVSLNPLTLLISLAGIACLFHHTMKRFWPVAVSIFISAALLVLYQGKGYYFYPIALTLFPFGGVFWENILLTKTRWLIYPLSGVLLLGVVMIPFGMPVFPLDSYLKHDYPYESSSIPGGQYAVRFEERYSTEKWAETLHDISVAYHGLPDKDNVLIWGKHYGQAGAINLFGNQYDIPKAFSLHGSFYNWVPEGEMPEVTIALSYNVGDFFDAYFEEVEKVTTIYNPYSSNPEQLHQHIYICRKPKFTFDELQEMFEDRIFE